MFDNIGPVAAADKLTEFREDYSSHLPEEQNTKLRELLRVPGAPPKSQKGKEILFAVAVEMPLADEEAQTALLEVLGTCATICGFGQYSGIDATVRSWALATWAAYQLNPVGPEPETPEVLPEYTTVPPEPHTGPGVGVP